MHRVFLPFLLLWGLTACGGDTSVSSPPTLPGQPPGQPGTPAPDSRFADARLAECVLDSDKRDVGDGLDAPGLRQDVPVPAVGRATGACADNQRFRVGTGIFDVTGPVALKSGAGWEDTTQVMRGLHQRQYARAYAIESPCNGKRIMFVSADIGLMWGSLRTGVLDAIAADPALRNHYAGDNLMLSATHTHSGPAGYSHTEAGNALHLGYDDLVYQTLVNGMVEAIRRAHANIEAHPAPIPIDLASGELLNTNINRSRPAFAMNPLSERAQFLDTRGEEVDVNKLMVQLNLRRENGSPLGVINWFGVHPTVIGPEADMVSGDCKGFASLGFERIMRTRYDRAPGDDTFVAAFAQADEGDASPNIFIDKFPHPDPRRGGGLSVYESNAISGTKQLARAMELWQEGAPISGPVDYRLIHVRMNRVTVNDPVVLARLDHPPELDSPVKRTCNAALGVSFPAGAEDGPGPISREGVTCAADSALLRAIAQDFAGMTDLALPVDTVSSLLLCNTHSLPLLGLDCHAEKPVLLPTNLGDSVLGVPDLVLNLLGLTLNFESSIQPLQVFRIGNLAIVGLPWEVTTMSARRLRALVLDELAPVGVDTVIIAGLVNDYVHYLTTREEYASQQYEGASTVYGPWSLAAVMQETRRLVISLRQGDSLPSGPAYPRSTPVLRRPPYVPSDSAGGGRYGDLLSDVPATATGGDRISASFRAGHPRNDLMLQDSYVFVERLEQGEWVTVATDRDPGLWFLWSPPVLPPLPLDPLVVGPSTAEVIWHVPHDAPDGFYRLRHQGRAAPGGAYEGISGPVAITGANARCPGLPIGL
ncbi:neutral/alkaline non-lysosomal ceramidase N-terminal domain-containing protein [Isoalcanivorax indicus]|uniref:neutral/alkaline non-lysosomal ceramidase N-terminal domain-containing protein n=1 Tax=Isoalcanivorax indicus TaxID=2202653 RepID=UPI0013C4C6C0|nr:neutral/alkaline non-lysosomal ceramidase N-terminal domain-containing protein [Isoalcanivorax indicus]